MQLLKDFPQLQENYHDMIDMSTRIYITLPFKMCLQKIHEFFYIKFLSNILIIPSFFGQKFLLVLQIIPE